jgi:hypothetical protein
LDELGFQNDLGKRDFVSSFTSKVEIVELLVMSLLGNLEILFPKGFGMANVFQYLILPTHHSICVHVKLNLNLYQHPL